MSITLLLLIISIAGFLFLRSRRPKQPMIIISPTLGFLNLKGTEGEPLVKEDHSTLAPLFGDTYVSVDEPPECDVLFVYCDLQEDGLLAGTTVTLRGVAEQAGATLVVVASANPIHSLISSKAFIESINLNGLADSVLTFDRCGPVFPSFFERLFLEMYKGVSLGMAWVTLVPQVPNMKHDDCPATIGSFGHNVEYRRG